MTTYDLWVQRDPRIKKAEWHELIERRRDLQRPKGEFGDFPEGAATNEHLAEFAWWVRGTGIPVKVAFIAGAIHIESGDSEAWRFAGELAAEVNGEVNC